MKPDQTAKRLRELLHYDPETGAFTRKIDRGGHPKGSAAGTVDPSGYVKIYIDGRNYWGHRLAWLYAHGEWPKKMLDHRNMDRYDNRIANLREASNGENMCNTGVSAKNTSGIKGVFFHNGAKRWAAQIVVNKTHYWLGLFDTKEEAGEAWKAAAKRLHGEFMRAA